MQQLEDEHEHRYPQYGVHELQSSQGLAKELGDTKASSPPIQYYAHYATPTKNPFEPKHHELDAKDTEPVEMPSTPGLKKKF